MENFDSLVSIELNSGELLEIDGGIRKKLLDWTGDWLFGKIADSIVDYAMVPVKQVDINHARNGGFQIEGISA